MNYFAVHTSCHNQVMTSAPPWKSIIPHPLCTVCSVFYFAKYKENTFALGFRHHCLDPICDLWNIKKVWNITLCWNHPPWRERAVAKRIITSPSLKSRAGVWISQTHVRGRGRVSKKHLRHLYCSIKILCRIRDWLNAQFWPPWNSNYVSSPNSDHNEQ